jgi:hypothetical protein
MEPFPPDLDKTQHGMPEDRFEYHEPDYNEEGVDLSYIRGFLAMTPTERVQHATAMARLIEEVRARGPSCLNV